MLKIVYGKLGVHAMITFRLGFGCSEVIEADLSDSFTFCNPFCVTVLKEDFGSS